MPSSMQQVQLLVLQADVYDWPTILKGATLQERAQPSHMQYEGLDIEIDLNLDIDIGVGVDIHVLTYT